MNYDTLKKIFFLFDPETAHKIAEFGLRALYATPGGLEALAKFGAYKDEILTQNIWDLSFDNPVGIAGGFDKNATMIAPLAALGFGHIDFGTFTPRPQSGNEKPRLFRLVSEQSIQNAMGFNNEGADIIEHRVRKIYPFVIPIAANIGKNKATPNEDALSDYEALGRKFNGLCDFFIINVSSPNTPNLRALQENSFISELIGAMKKITNRPLVLKLAPDMSADQAIALCECAVQSGASGIIINNTSVDYSLSPNARDFGGLSGRLITEKSRELFAQVARELFGRTILISCGGIDSAQEAYERIKSGASLVQIFTAFIFKGPFVAKSINEGLAELLRADGFNSVGEAVGANLKDRAGEGYGARGDRVESRDNGADLRACEDKEADKISSAPEGEETSEISNAPESRDADEIPNDGKSEISSAQADKIPAVQTNSSSEADENSDASANLNALVNADTATDQRSIEQSSAESENSEIKSSANNKNSEVKNTKRSSAKSKNLEAKSIKQSGADRKSDKISKGASKGGTEQKQSQISKVDASSKRGKISKDASQNDASQKDDAQNGALHKDAAQDNISQKDATQKDTAQKDTAQYDDASQKDVAQDNSASQQNGAEAKNISKSDAKSENLEVKNAKQSVAASKTAKTKTASKNKAATKVASKNDIESKNSKTKTAPKNSAESKSSKSKNVKQSSAKTKNAEAKEAKEASGTQNAEQNSSKKRKAKKD